MDTQALFARQQQRRQCALQILAQLDLIKRWSVCGRAVLVGEAYEVDLGSVNTDPR